MNERKSNTLKQKLHIHYILKIDILKRFKRRFKAKIVCSRLRERREGAGERNENGGGGGGGGDLKQIK